MRVTFIASQQQLAVSPHLLGVSFRSFPLFFRVYLTLRNITVINTLFCRSIFFLFSVLWSSPSRPAEA